MLSQKARYAIRALLVLAKGKPGAMMSVAEVAAEASVPRKFLEQILLELKRRSILHSERGKFGGYVLARAPSAISFAEIIRAIDGPLALAPCASQTAYRRCDDCVDEKTCAIRNVLLSVRDATAEILEGHSLANALEDDGKPRKKKPIGL